MRATADSRHPRRGRPATASRADVRAAARAQFMAGERIRGDHERLHEVQAALLGVRSGGSRPTPAPSAASG